MTNWTPVGWAWARSPVLRSTATRSGVQEAVGHGARASAVNGHVGEVPPKVTGVLIAARRKPMQRCDHAGPSAGREGGDEQLVLGGRATGGERILEMPDDFGSGDRFRTSGAVAFHPRLLV